MRFFKTIGLTGGIGSGKSVVARILRCNGFPVYDCDSEAKSIMRNDSNVKKKLIDRLGTDIYMDNGEINRQLLAKDIFNDETVRAYVNSIVHKAVRQDISLRREKISGVFFIETAIIATGGLESFCQQIWIVNCNLDERLKRIERRDGSELEAILCRIKTQKKELENLPLDKIVTIENGFNQPILPLILRLTDRLKINQKYKIIC